MSSTRLRKVVWSACGAAALTAIAVALPGLVAAEPATTAASAPAVGETPAIDPVADRILKASCKYIADAKALSFKSEEWDDVILPSGQKIQITRKVTIEEKRPDALHIEVASAHRSHGIWYRGKSLTILDRKTNFYGTAEVPDSIDKTIDKVEEDLGIDIPMADLLLADPYASAMEGVKTARYLGKTTVLNTACHHLAFIGRNADWQIWIQDGPKPLPVKVVINHKGVTGSPQFTAILSDWDLTGPISDDVFNFVAPPGAFKVDVHPAPDAAAPAATK